MSKEQASKDMTWEEAIETVLRAAEGPLQRGEIAERIATQGLRSKVGANPSGAISAILSRLLAEEDTPFQRVGRGEYTVKDRQLPDAVPAAEPARADAADSETGSLRAFGMFWRREHVSWAGKPKLFGRQGLGASQVNFSEQVGVYLLHDRERVIYVGRATENLFSRLRAHPVDRLGGRWDRFSWFGLKGVNDDGSLGEASVPWSSTVVIETMEALLIESLEPPLNRKRGDNFSAAEYLQVLDPDLEKARKRNAIAELMKSADLDS